MLSGEQFELKPINSRFKRLIHDFGDKWVALGDSIPMPCFHGEEGVTAGPLGNLTKKISNFRLSDIELKE